MFTLTLCTYVNSDLFPFSSTITMPHARKHWRRTTGRGQTPTGSMDLPIVNESARRTLHRPLTGNSNFYMRGGDFLGIGKFFKNKVYGKFLKPAYNKVLKPVGKAVWKSGIISKGLEAAGTLTGQPEIALAGTAVGALGGGKLRRKGKRGGGYWPEYHTTMPYRKPYRKPYRDPPPHEGMTVPMKGGANRTMDMVMGYDPAIGKFRPMSQHQAVANRTHIL